VRKDCASELFCGKRRVAGIIRNLATAVSDTTDNTNELGMRVTRKLLKLVDDAKRRTWVRLLGSEHQADAFPGHAVNDTSGVWIRSRIVAEGAVKKRLHLGRQTIPIHGRTEDDPLGWEEILEQERPEVIRDGARAAGQTTCAAVTEKTRNEVINEAQCHLRPCRLCAALHGFGECG